MLRYLSSSLFLAIITLLGIGLVQVYSSSFIFAIESYGDGLFFFKRQLIFTVLAMGILVATIHIPFRYIEKYGWALWFVATLGVLATFVPGLGVRVGGATRWIQLPLGVRFEPGELLKIAFSVWFASLLCRQENFLGRVKWHWIFVALVAPMALLLKQPDFGTFAIIVMVAVTLLFAFGLQWKYIIGAVAVMIPAFYFLVMTVPYRRARVLAFLDPWADPAQKGFQVIQSMLSFHSGGLTGAGLGQGQGKLFFLPEAHTDFTLAVLGEEMGFVGFVLILALYGFVVFRGMQIAVKAEEPFKRALALGLSVTFGLSVFINAGVVMGLLPTKGLTLPFLSYGGSSLVSLCFMFGLILNIENSFEEDKFSRRFGSRWTASKVKN
ncbi:putative peptidoglycan glycosyltransferase FtsW [Bdellovibrio bacteriovorus]|uniref:putative lipid II flippase FtsW n=1 Tax=Bdellovibrio bacteriovorus TaxID=959 RepID=UPI00045C0F2A|nr:putative lipid II flippase FtsW [Bdellovibrio bacteriovorus]AHZ83584.1 cell division protein FtsW [Bdellovibrio bacteriovorus]BEV69554.1 putative peptidoglycan glycosyltransferase FtsW [Bdellovibrio bacteriovorus]